MDAMCNAETMGSYCGFPLSPDGSCPNSGMHRDVFEAQCGADVCDRCLDMGAIELPKLLPCPDCRADEHQAEVEMMLLDVDEPTTRWERSSTGRKVRGPE